MTAPLIAARDAFAARHPEAAETLHGRAWGVLEAGRGPALLLLPGTLGRADIFWQQIAALSDRLRVLSVSYPAAGGVAEWVGDLVALMDRRGVAEAAVLGSSLGGFLAQGLAARIPDRIVHLIPANTLSATAGLAQRPPYSSDLDHGPIAELRAGFGRALTAWGESHPEQAELVALLLQEVGGRIPEAELRARLKALKTAPERAPAVPLPPGRITTVEADDDPLIPPEKRAGVRAHLAPAVACRFAWGGHFPYVVRPAEYTALIETALGLAVTGPGWGSGAERVR